MTKQNEEKEDSAIREENKNMKIKTTIILAALTVLSSCGTLRGRHKAAPNDNIRLTSAQSRKYDYFFLEGERLKLKGDDKAALEIFDHCLKINPEGTAALYEKAEIHSSKGDLAKAGEELALAVRLDPSNYWYRHTLATIYQKRGRWDKATKVYEGTVKRFPDKLQPVIALTGLYEMQERYDDEIKLLNMIANSEGPSEQLSMEKFRVYVKKNDMPKALEEIKNLAAEFPYDMKYLTLAGDLYMQTGDKAKAIETYNKVIDEDSTYAPAHFSLFSYYQEQQQDSAAYSHLDKFLYQKGVSTELKMDIMRRLIFSGAGKSDDIIKLFDKILLTGPDTADLPLLASQYYLTKGLEAKARGALEMVLKIEPDNMVARLRLLQFILRENNPDKIIDICLPGLSYRPDMLQFYYYLGAAYYQKDEKELARQTVRLGTTHISKESDKYISSAIWGILGDIEHDLGDTAAAFEAYEKSLAIIPDNPGILNNYAYFLSTEKKELDKAEEMSYKSVKAEPDNGTFLDTYAWILYEKTRYTEAMIYIDQAMKNGGDKSTTVTEHCGDIYFKNGKKAEALEYWEKAEKLSQTDKEGEENYRNKSSMEELRKKIKRAK